MANLYNYFYEKFEDCYRAATRAKQIGDLVLAKQKYAEAAGYLESYADRVSGEEKRKARERAERLHAIASSITVEAQPQRASSKSAPTAASSDLTDSEAAEFITFFDASAISVTFEDVIGLEKAKHTVTEYVINPIKYAQFYNYDFTANKSVLLYGPPGTGKTTFAKAVAKELAQPFALVNVAALVNCYIGETGKNIDKIFVWLRDYANKHGNAITVFFDELDEIAKKRGGEDKASAAAVPALLRNLDGLKDNKGFLILANTNCPEALDAGVLDRFRQRIYIPLPDEDDRKKLFKSKLSDVEPEFVSKLDINAMAAASEGMSGRTITYICDDFKYFIGGVKAGIKDGSDVNAAMLAFIADKRE